MIDWSSQFERFRHDRRAPLLITGLFSIALLWTLTTTFFTFFSKHKINAPVVDNTPTSTPIRLGSLHLFGVYSDISANLPVTSLHLLLQGTLLVKDAPDFSLALISAANNPAKLYQVGDVLVPTNATITHIYKYYVVINDNGAMQKLPLPIKTVLENFS